MVHFDYGLVSVKQQKYYCNSLKASHLHHISSQKTSGTSAPDLITELQSTSYFDLLWPKLCLIIFEVQWKGLAFETRKLSYLQWWFSLKGHLIWLKQSWEGFEKDLLNAPFAWTLAVTVRSFLFRVVIVGLRSFFEWQDWPWKIDSPIIATRLCWKHPFLEEAILCSTSISQENSCL